MQVELIDYTGAGSPDPARWAASVLIFTKNTRLNMSPAGFHDIQGWSQAQRSKELEYAARTLPSSWEFIHYSFAITGVTRAFTHQLVRTRTASYAQQAMRVVDLSAGFEYATGPTVKADDVMHAIYRDAMDGIRRAYAGLVQRGSRTEDARGLLPTNVLTNICMSANLRTICDMARKRSSARVQDEYRSVVEGIKAAVLAVHPWTEAFLNRNFDAVALELQEKIMQLPEGEGRLQMIKLLDQLRME